jgi:hypothetical protein
MLRSNPIDGSRGVVPTLGRLVRRPALTLAIAGGLGSGSRVLAQAELQGRVFADSARRPVMNAEVAIPRLGLRTLSDSLGRYRLRAIPRGEHLVITRAVGFRPDSAMTALDGDEALVRDVVLKPPMTSLATVAVRETPTMLPRGKMGPYEMRKATGVGHFIDRDLLAKDEHRGLGDILQSNVPGLAIYRGSGSRTWAATSRNRSSAKCAMCKVSKNEMLDGFDVAAGAPLACYLDVYLDGVQVYNSSARQMPLFNLNSMSPSEIQAIEVYSGPSQIPAQYNKTSGGCGVMLVWTRVSR